MSSLRQFELSTPGLPLQKSVREEMETLFKADFSDVRIHTSRRVARFGAAALTCGHHIVFSPLHFQPDVEFGRFLLAHELTHVLQQRRRLCSHKRGHRPQLLYDRRMEVEADRNGVCAMRREALPPSASDCEQDGSTLTPCLEMSAVIQPKFVGQAAIAAPTDAAVGNIVGTFENIHPAHGAIQGDPRGMLIHLYTDSIYYDDIHVGNQQTRQYFLPMITDDPGPEEAFFAKFIGGEFISYVAADGVTNVLQEKTEVVDDSNPMHNAPHAALQTIEGLISNFGVTSVARREVSRKVDYVGKLEGESSDRPSNRIDREGPCRDATHAKFRLQMGSKTYAGIEMQAEEEFSIKLVRKAFRDSLASRRYVRIYKG